LVGRKFRRRDGKGQARAPENGGTGVAELFQTRWGKKGSFRKRRG